MTGLPAPDVLERLGASLFVLGPDAILVGRPDGSILRANPAACRLLRGTEEAVARAGRSGLVVPDDAFQDAIARRESTGSVQCTIQFRRLDGEEFPAEMSSTVVRASDGTPFVVTIFRDVSERLAIERSLAHTRRTLRMVTRCSEAILRAGTEEALYRDVCHLIVEEGGHRMAWVGRAETDERRTVRPLVHAGHEDGYLAGIDVVWADEPNGRGPTGTAIRENRVVVGTDFRVAPALAPWRELALAHGFASSTALPISFGEERFGVLTMYSGRVDAFSEEEVDLLRRLAADVGYAVAALRHRDEKHRADEARARSEERFEALESAQRSLQEQFQQAQKLESVGRLAGGVAHDFNNLLTIIIACAEDVLASVQAGQPAEPEFLEDIVHAGRRASDLTQQLLAFARKQVVSPASLDLSDVIRRGEKLLRRVIGEDVRVVQRLEPHPWPVRADPGLVSQVLMNLAVNARDAMPGGGTLVLSTRNVELGPGRAGPEPSTPPGQYVALTVEDDGVGMTADVMAHLFEPFFTTKERGKGTGLGLATVYGIVKQSGGHLGVRSTPGEGTTFEIWLPRDEEVAAAAPEPPAAPRGGDETILLVEDDPKVREVTARMLRSGGYRVLATEGGYRASEIARTEPGPIHLLVTDVVMPGPDGREIARRIGELKPGLRVLYISGYTDDALARQGVLDPAIDLVQKPFTPAVLLARVRAALDRR